MTSAYQQRLIACELNVSGLISLFHDKSPRNFSFTGESHDFWEFIYIDKGQMKIIAGDQPYILKAGELAFHQPGEFHAVYAHDNIPANFIVCAFTCNSVVMRYFAQKILFLNGDARECLYAAVRETHGNLPPVAETEPQVLCMSDAPFGAGQMIRNYLEQHLADRLTLDKIAKDLGYSTSQMKKLFKAETGHSIMDTLIGMKMDEARRMIQEGSLNITQIAGQLGFESTQYFSRQFKNRNKMTPTEYSRSIGN